LILAAKSYAGIYITISLFLNKQPRVFKDEIAAEAFQQEKKWCKKDNCWNLSAR